jgi:hypothetical protein
VRAAKDSRRKAVELADVLSEGGWDAALCGAWCADAETQLARAIAGFEYWYSGELLERAEATTEVRDNFLLGTAFQARTAKHDGNVLRDAGLTKGAHRRELDPAYAVDWGDVERHIVPKLRGLLALAPEQRLAGWAISDARAPKGGLQARWRAEGKPELTTDLAFDADGPCFTRVGAISLGFMNLLEGPYPFDGEVQRLFDSVAAHVRGREDAWRALSPGAPRT